MVVIDPPKQSIDLLREALNIKEPTPNTAPEEDEDIEILSYVASLAATLSKTEDFGSDIWIDSLSPYLESLNDKYETNKAIEKYRALSEKATLNNEDEESDDDDDNSGEELCNIRFSLAYGGKILLHQTKLKLRRGNRYALVGQNGAGKTTLMTAINVSFLMFFFSYPIQGLCAIFDFKAHSFSFFNFYIRMVNLKGGHFIFVLSTLTVEVM